MSAQLLQKQLVEEVGEFLYGMVAEGVTENGWYITEEEIERFFQARLDSHFAPFLDQVCERHPDAPRADLVQSLRAAIRQHLAKPLDQKRLADTIRERTRKPS